MDVSDVIGGLVDLVFLLLWLPRVLWRLWRWLTEERTLPQIALAGTPQMGDVRHVARILLGTWLFATLAAIWQWNQPWLDSGTTFLIGLAGFAVGPVLLVAVTGFWRNRIVGRASRGPIRRPS